MLQEAETLLRRLHDHQVDFVIIGGICNVLHGATLVTQDLDICCPFTPENLEHLDAAVRDLHPVHRLTPRKIPFVLTDRLAKELKNVYLGTDAGVIDCVSEVSGVGDYETVFRVSIPVTLSFGQCRMLSLDALMRSKEALGREQDMIALRQLRAIKERRDQENR